MSFYLRIERKCAIIYLILIDKSRLIIGIALPFKNGLKAIILGENMRKVIDIQMKFGEVDISKIEFDPRSRDEIPKLLIGLQEIYCNRKVRE